MIHRLTLVLCLSLGLAGAQEPGQQPQDLASLLPARTLFMAEFDDLGGFQKWQRDTALGRIYAEPEMQQFIKGLHKSIGETMQRFGGANPFAMIGLQPADFEGIEFRRVGFAVVDATIPKRGMPKVDAVITLQIRSGAENVVKIAGAIRNALNAFLGVGFEDVDMHNRKVGRTARAGHEFHLLASGDRILITTTRERMDQMLRAMDGGNMESLARTEKFSTILKRMHASERAMLIYGNLEALYSKGVAIAREHESQRNVDEFERVWNGLGLGGMKALAIADIPAGTGFRTEFAITHDNTGLFALTPPGLVDHRFARHAPKGALLYGSETYDIGQIFDAMMDLMGKLMPANPGFDAKAWVLGQIRNGAGIDLHKDVFAHLGTVWSGYLGAPPNGGLIPDFAMFVSVKNRVELEKTLDKLAAFFKGHAVEHGVEVTIGETHFRGMRIHYLEMVQKRGDPIPVAPAWAFGEDFLVVGLFPQTIKHAMTQKASMTANADFMALTRHVPQTASSVSYIDLGGMVTWLYNTAVPVLQGMQGAINKELKIYGVKLNFQDLPPSEVLARHLTGLVSYAAAEKGCVRAGYISSFGAPALIVPIAFVGGVAGALYFSVEADHRQATARERREVEHVHDAARMQAQLAEQRAQYEQRLRHLEEQLAELKRLIDEKR